MDDPGMIIYFIATRPNIEKAMGERIYLDKQEAHDIAAFWRQHIGGPWCVYRAIVSQVEEVKEAAVENW